MRRANPTRSSIAVDSERSSIDENVTIRAPNSASNRTISVPASSASFAVAWSSRTSRSAMGEVIAASYWPASFRRAVFDIEMSGGRRQSRLSY